MNAVEKARFLRIAHPKRPEPSRNHGTILAAVSRAVAPTSTWPISLTGAASGDQKPRFVGEAGQQLAQSGHVGRGRISSETFVLRGNAGRRWPTEDPGESSRMPAMRCQREDWSQPMPSGFKLARREFEPPRLTSGIFSSSSPARRSARTLIWRLIRPRTLPWTPDVRTDPTASECQSDAVD